MDEAYIQELLETFRQRESIHKRKLTLSELREMCVLDVNAGYRVEVNEAIKRYSPDKG